MLEKVDGRLCRQGVVLAKVDVDKSPFIAAQFQVRSIPTVYAMHQGQLVADLSQARTETQLRTLLDQILRQIPLEGEADDPAAELEPLIAMGEQVLAEGDAERALSIFDQIAEIAPGHPVVTAGRARALLALGRADEADAALAALEGRRPGRPRSSAPAPRWRSPGKQGLSTTSRGSPRMPPPTRRHGGAARAGRAGRWPRATATPPPRPCSR